MVDLREFGGMHNAGARGVDALSKTARSLMEANAKLVDELQTVVRDDEMARRLSLGEYEGLADRIAREASQGLELGLARQVSDAARAHHDLCGLSLARRDGTEFESAASRTMHDVRSLSRLPGVSEELISDVIRDAAAHRDMMSQFSDATRLAALNPIAQLSAKVIADAVDHPLTRSMEVARAAIAESNTTGMDRLRELVKDSELAGTAANALRQQALLQSANERSASVWAELATATRDMEPSARRAVDMGARMPPMIAPRRDEYQEKQLAGLGRAVRAQTRALCDLHEQARKDARRSERRQRVFQLRQRKMQTRLQWILVAVGVVGAGLATWIATVVTK